MKFNFMKNELLTYTMSPKEKNFRPKQTELNHRRNIFTCILSNSVALVSMFSYNQHRDSINKEKTTRRRIKITFYFLKKS